MQMNDDGMVDVLDLAESVNEFFYIVARFHIHVVEAKRAKDIVAALAVALTQCCQTLVHTAMVLSDGHPVVIEEHNEVGSCLRRYIESFEGFAS